VPYARYAFNGVPVGSIIAFGGDKNNVPEGWLLCDGSSVSQTDYSQLYAMIGAAWGSTGSSFNLPDLQGRFLRGVDDGAGLDPNAGARTAIKTGGNTGDNVGTIQSDDTKSHLHAEGTLATSTAGNHSHTINSTEGGDTSGDGAQVLNNPDSNPNINAPTLSAGDHTHTITGSTASTGGNETRPVNAGVFYIIKY
jgi:microcystin-dependent protein